MRFPYKGSNIPSEILQICRATFSTVQFVETSKVFLRQMLRQGADPIGVKRY